MKWILATLVWVFASVPAAIAGGALGQSDATIISSVDTSLQKLVLLHQRIRDIHPSLHSLHPIAVVEEGTLFIFDSDSATGVYRFQKKEPVPFPMEKGIRASFPLSSYDNRPTCIVSRDVFESLGGYATIFHEFIHCAQYLTCENKLKQRLHIAQTAATAKNYSWEINHPFPYGDTMFVRAYTGFLQALAAHDISFARTAMRELKRRLSQDDYEYMVWVEWKEGFARYIENKIRAAFDLKENQGGNEQPFNRVTFYYGGEALIRSLVHGNQDRPPDVERLLDQMFAFAGPE